MLSAATMEHAVLAGFEGATRALHDDMGIMPLDRWNESVLRYHFCCATSRACPEVEQFVECGKIDLVLASGELRAFVEFKYYWHPRRHDPYGGHNRGFKGGPSRKNLLEFESCVNQLAARDAKAGLSKFVVLFYADRIDADAAKLNYGGCYNEYCHGHSGVGMRTVKRWGPVNGGGGVARAVLFEVSGNQV